MCGLIIQSEAAATICRAADGSMLRVSFDLGRTTETVERVADGIVRHRRMIPMSVFLRVASAGHTLYFLNLSTLSMTPLEQIRDAKLYQLRSTRMAPTVMISGIQMHSLDNAWKDARSKAALVVRQGDWVLDTCGGLLYTASASIDQGAGLVITTEPDPTIRWLRTFNPWSAIPANAPVISFEIPCQELLGRLPDSAMDCVVHDPPRFSLAGDLYSERLYSSLRRIIRPGGKLYHYTGEPYSKGRGRRFVKGVAKRLTSAGFDVRWHQESTGLVGRARR